MKKIILTALSVVLSTAAFSQIQAPVKWSYAAKKVSKDQAVVFVKATIEKGWHIYSQNAADDSQLKTSLTFNKDNNYTLIGNTSEPKPQTKFEPSIKTNVGYFEQSVIFQQKVKLNATAATVNGTVNYLVCDSKQCLPPEEVEFKIPVK